MSWLEEEFMSSGRRRVFSEKKRRIRISLLNDLGHKNYKQYLATVLKEKIVCYNA